MSEMGKDKHLEKCHFLVIYDWVERREERAINRIKCDEMRSI
jgi:hypothetical protein